jgi:hypothetical protein
LPGNEPGGHFIKNSERGVQNFETGLSKEGQRGVGRAFKGRGLFFLDYRVNVVFGGSN